jgi:hypothetical protein
MTLSGAVTKSLLYAATPKKACINLARPIWLKAQDPPSGEANSTRTTYACRPRRRIGHEQQGLAVRCALALVVTCATDFKRNHIGIPWLAGSS